MAEKRIRLGRPGSGSGLCVRCRQPCDRPSGSVYAPLRHGRAAFQSARCNLEQPRRGCPVCCRYGPGESLFGLLCAFLCLRGLDPVRRPCAGPGPLFVSRRLRGQAVWLRSPAFGKIQEMVVAGPCGECGGHRGHASLVRVFFSEDLPCRDRRKSFRRTPDRLGCAPLGPFGRSRRRARASGGRTRSGGRAPDIGPLDSGRGTLGPDPRRLGSGRCTLVRGIGPAYGLARRGARVFQTDMENRGACLVCVRLLPLLLDGSSYRPPKRDS